MVTSPLLSLLLPPIPAVGSGLTPCGEPSRVRAVTFDGEAGALGHIEAGFLAAAGQGVFDIPGQARVILILIVLMLFHYSFTFLYFNTRIA